MRIGGIEAGGTKMVCAIGDETGKILEEGTHDELLAKGGEYARLYRVQNALDANE